MSSLKLDWTGDAKSNCHAIARRAKLLGRQDDFRRVHSIIFDALSDLNTALKKGVLVSPTNRPGGQIRYWVEEFVAVSYAVFADDGVGWIFEYRTIPQSWPE